MATFAASPETPVALSTATVTLDGDTVVVDGVLGVCAEEIPGGTAPVVRGGALPEPPPPSRRACWPNRKSSAGRF